MSQDDERAALVGLHKPGSIQRIKLQNFLTYANVEFFPGPRLNMVVGPNGTGKSTILCAICLGLGGEPKLLGRADDETQFIMHDTNVALVEIEVTPLDGGETHVFKRRIERGKGKTKGRGASTYFINDERVTPKKIRQTVGETYHISVDNLCTFLPQDRVGSFSGFSAQQMLQETEKSMSGSKHLYETHQQLIQMEHDLLKGGCEVETVQAQLQKLESETATLEREVERMEQREQALEQLQLYEQKFVWVKFDQCREETQLLKNAKDEHKAKLREAKSKIRPLEEAHEALVTKRSRYDARSKTLETTLRRSKQEMDKQAKKAETHSDTLDALLSSLNSLDASQKIIARKIAAQKLQVEKAEEKLASMPSKQQVDEAQREAAADNRDLRPSYSQARSKATRIHEELVELRDTKSHALSKLSKMNDDKARRREKVFRQIPDLHKIAQWVDANRNKFRRPVWGPIVTEVTMKSANTAAFLEFHVPTATLKSFVVECKEDQDLLYQEIRVKRKTPINIIVVKNQGKLLPVQPEYSEGKMRTLKQDHGVQGTMDESFEAPDAIRQALRDNAAVHKTLIGGTKTMDSIDNGGLLEYLCQAEGAGGQRRGSCIIANKGDRSFRFTNTISRYSSKLAIDQTEIPPARLLGPGVNPTHKAKLEKEIAEMDANIQEQEAKEQEAKGKFDELQGQMQQLQARLKQTKDAQANLQKAQANLERQKRKLAQAEEEALTDNTGEKERLLKSLQARMASCVTALEAHADQHGKIMDSTFSSAGVRINQDAMAFCQNRAKQALDEAQQEFNELDQEGRRVVQDFNRKKSEMRELKQLAEEKAPLMDENGNELPLKKKLEELPVTTIAEIEAAMEEANAKANGIDANPQVIRQYQEKQQEIEMMRSQLEELTDSKASKVHELDKKRSPWEEALNNAMSKVQTLFAKYMEELGCAGDVALVKGNFQDEDSTGNFKDWGIEIRVKFREKSKLQALSARVQSGGERSVSTIMYLMALQELMVSPFRCVDEINQGLDERNERLVFKRIVENSTRPPSRGSLTNHSGQYFLITPKLLPNLYDMESEAMTVLFIFNGPYNFETPLDWNKDAYVEAGASNDEDSEEDGEADENSSSGANAEGANRSKKKRRVS